jgi:hypothetical protein
MFGRATGLEGGGPHHSGWALESQGGERACREAGWLRRRPDRPVGHLRFIEVKGRHAEAREVIVTKNEILASLNAPDRGAPRNTAETNHT